MDRGQYDPSRCLRWRAAVELQFGSGRPQQRGGEQQLGHRPAGEHLRESRPEQPGVEQYFRIEYFRAALGLREAGCGPNQRSYRAGGQQPVPWEYRDRRPKVGHSTQHLRHQSAKQSFHRTFRVSLCGDRQQHWPCGLQRQRLRSRGELDRARCRRAFRPAVPGRAGRGGSLAEDASHLALGTRFFDVIEDGRIGDVSPLTINTLGEGSPEFVESVYSITLFGDPAAPIR